MIIMQILVVRAGPPSAGPPALAEEDNTTIVAIHNNSYS